MESFWRFWQVMAKEISAKIRNLFSTHAREMMEALREEMMDFSVICETSMIGFYPELGHDARSKLGDMTAFVLSGYSLSSLNLEDAVFEFEAGLISQDRDDQFGTIVRIPYIAIMQIFIENENLRQKTVLFYNPYEPDDCENVRSSMLAVLSKNGHLLKG